MGFERWDLNRTSKDRICMHEYIQEWGCVSPTNCSIKKSSRRGGEGSVHLPRPRSQLLQTFYFFLVFFFLKFHWGFPTIVFYLILFLSGPPTKMIPNYFISTLSFYFLINTFYLFIYRLISRYIPWANQNGDASCGFVADEETVGAQYGIRFFFPSMSIILMGCSKKLLFRVWKGGRWLVVMLGGEANSLANGK